MQTRKALFVIGLTATLTALGWTSVARDTPEQIKAREALRQKMAELDAAAAASKPVPPPPPPAPPAAPLAEPAKKAPVPVPAPVPAPAPAPAAKAASDSIYGPVPDGVEDAKTAERREALRKEMAALQPAPALVDKPVRPVKPVKSGRAAAYTPPSELPAPALEVPLSPLTGSKAARMAELLQRYNADQITPKDYHTQRAAILAEP